MYTCQQQSDSRLPASENIKLFEKWYTNILVKHDKKRLSRFLDLFLIFEKHW